MNFFKRVLSFRRVWLAVSVAVATILLLVAVAHTPPARAFLLGLVTNYVRAAAGIDLHADRLVYNLFTLTVDVTGLRLAATATPSVPFFEADEVHADLSWNIVRGYVFMESLHVARPRVSVRRGADGTLNLPGTGETGGPGGTRPVPIGIGRLVVRDLAATYVDESRTLRVELLGLTADLTARSGGGVAGRLRMTRGGRIRVGGHETMMTRLDGRLAFDGAVLAIEDLVFEAPEATMALRGRLDLLAPRPRIAVVFDGRVNLTELARWASLDPALAGVLIVEGRAEGPLTTPRATIQFSGDQLAWGELTPVSVRAVATAETTGIAIEALTLRLAGGDIDGRARANATEVGVGGDVRLTWRGVDARRLLSTFGADRHARIASQLDGSLTATWARAGFDALDLTLDNRARPLVRVDRALPLEGRLRLVTTRGHWRLEHDHRAGSIRLAGTSRGELRAPTLRASTLGGTATVEARDLGRAADDLRAAGLHLPGDPAGALAGDLRSAVTLSGTLGAPVVQGSIEVNGLHVRQIGPGGMAAQLSLVGNRARLEVVDLSIGPNRVQGLVDLNLGNLAIDGRFAGELQDLPSLMRGLPESWQATGAITFEATLAGTAPAPRITARLTGEAIEVAGQRMDRVAVAFSLGRQQIVLDTAEIVQAEEGKLTLTGRYDFASRRYALSALGDRFTLHPIPAVGPAEPSPTGANLRFDGIPITARLGFRVEADGSLERPAGRADLVVEDLRWGDYTIGRGRFEVDLGDERAHFNAMLPDLSTSFRGSVGVTTPRPFTLTARADGLDLSRLTRLAPSGRPDATLPNAPRGVLTLAATASGELDRLAEADVDLRLERVDASIRGLPLRLARPGRLCYVRRNLVVEDVELRVGDTVLALDGRTGQDDRDPGLRVSLDGHLRDVLDVVRLAAPQLALQGDGPVAARIAATGPLVRPLVTADLKLSGVSLTGGGVPPVSVNVLEASYRDGRLRVTPVEAQWQQATLSASGELSAALLDRWLPAAYLASLPEGPRLARLEVRVESLTEQALAPFLDRDTLERVNAELSGTLEIETESLDPGGMRGSLQLDRAVVVLAGVPLQQLRPTRFTLAQRRLRVDDFRWGGGGSDLVLGGDVAFPGASPILNLDLEGVLDVRALSVWVPDAAISGSARLRLAARGTPAEPSLDGSIALDGVEVRLRNPRLALSDLSGTVVFAKDRLIAQEITGSANGGTLILGGELTYPGLKLGAGSASILGRGLAMELPEGLRTEVNADLALAIGANRDPTLTGTITILRGAYRQSLSLTGLLLGTQTARGPVAAGIAEPSLADRIRLDIALVTKEDLSIDNNYGRLVLGGKLRLTGVLARPSIVGRATVREGGEIFLAGNTYVVEQGTVDFANPAEIEPGVSLRARTRIRAYDITLDIKGKPGAIEHTLASEPVLSESDIVSLLATGRTLSEAGSAQTQIAREQVLGYLTGDVLGLAVRAVGLDAVRFERGVSRDSLPTDLAMFAGDADPSSRLTVSKNVRRDVEIVLSQNLRESGGLTWIAMYRPLSNIELRTISRDDSSRAYEFRHTVQFGGGVRSPGHGLAGENRRRAPRVVAIRFGGAPGFDAAELQSRLDLTPGDEFDLFQWQRDRDRLLRFYHDRGFLEASVVARREPATDQAGRQGVALDYAITRGPQTTIRVEGYAAPRSLLSELSEAWGRAVFEGFLTDDVRRATRQHLASEGYLRASVAPEIVRGEAGEKTIVIQIDPGPRATRRAIVFEGTAQAAPDRLREFLRDQGLTLAAWLDPGAAQDELERFYRSEGFLVARVAITPVFDGDEARLTVRVNEGPSFAISEVQIEGARSRPRERLLEVVGLAPGDPYRAAAAEAGRGRIEADYRRHGFNNARARLAASVDRAAERVAVTLTVDEGPRQVLRDIELTGAEITRRDMVIRNLALDVGAPVDLGEWYRARKRLYDTGVFRSADIEVEPLAPTEIGDQAVRARVSLEEWPRFRLRYGVQLNDEAAPVSEAGRDISPGVVADLQGRNLLGRAFSAGIALRLQRDFRILRPFVSAPTFFGLPITSRGFLTRARQDFNLEGLTPFVDDTSGISLEQRLRPRETVEIAYSYRFESKRTFQPDPNPLDPLPLDVRTHVGRFLGSLVVETRDDPFDARTGWFHASTIEYSPQLFGSDLRFVKYLLQHYHFRPFGRTSEVTLASAARLGLARGFGQDLIPSEKFFTGGANSVRGYREDSLGERDFFGDPRGGNALVVLNQELRFPVFRWVRGVGFIDAGNVFTLVRDLSLRELRVGIGLGARITTPFALVRLDLGVPLSRRPGDPRRRWYISIGQAF